MPHNKRPPRSRTLPLGRQKDKSWWGKTKRFTRLLYLKVLRIQASPHNIAMGLAAGVFVGLLPVLPFQIVLAVSLAFLLKGNKIAAALGTWVSNPLNWVPFYLLFYHVGNTILPFEAPPFDPQNLEIAQMLDAGWKLFAVMMLGGVIVATPSAIASYFLTVKVITMYRKKKAERAAQKRKNALARNV